SPESLLNPLDRTPAGDQYSLGCILYYCLAGHFPFTYDNPVKKMLAHQAEEPRPIRDVNPEVSKGLAAIVARLMRKQPEERYGSPDEAVEAPQALTAPRKGQPWPASGLTPTQPLAAPSQLAETPPRQQAGGGVVCEDPMAGRRRAGRRRRAGAD